MTEEISQGVPVLVLGASGMLGSAVLRVLAESDGLAVTGTVRSARAARLLAPHLQARVTVGVDVENHDALVELLRAVRPAVVINCVGLVKQIGAANDPLQALPINALLPHRLARLSALQGARLIHISTDCVYDGQKGGYRETDTSNANDLYGRSKFLGEVDYPNAITLRTSIIGRELDSRNGLVEWFLAQEGRCKGFTRAIFSGLPTDELARVIRDHVLPNPDMTGVYHVASEPIDKYSLLTIIRDLYDKSIEIVPDDNLVIDRSLNYERFRDRTGYVAPSWPQLCAGMRDFGLSSAT
ncbi:SDR family oxidoreductase [Devosia sp. Root436]|uniref:dTDP-4-dehydrorhamnose reductase family protein n=1 Tax=Devosia sp. Root436 TaxID=1736537 RepID=UPI001FCCCA37|nr:SDR family oxidoreductase [Devosia sp. Root436]